MRNFFVGLIVVLGIGLVAAGCNDKDRDNTVYSTNSTPVNIVVPQTFPDADVGDRYDYTVQTTGGTRPFVFTISQGSLPSGLDIAAATGVISGLPTAEGQSNFTVRVTDAANNVSSYATAITTLNVR